MFLKTLTAASNLSVVRAVRRLPLNSPCVRVHLSLLLYGRARVVLCLVAIVFIAAGCSPAKAPVLPHHRIQLEALISLHPAYSGLSVLEIDAWGAQRKLDSDPLHPTPAVSAMPPVFLPPHGLPPDRVKEHESTVREDAARYITQLEAGLTERDNVQITVRQTAETQLADSQYAEALSKKTVELRDVAVVEARSVQRELDRLNYRAEALASQARVYAASGFNTRRLQDDVRVQQVEIDRRIQAKSAAVTGLLKADFKGLAVEALKPLRAELDGRAAANVKGFAEQLAAASKQESAEARKRLDDQPAAIEQLSDSRNSNDIPGSPRTAIKNPGANLNPGTAFMAMAPHEAEQDRIARAASALRLKEMLFADTRQCVERIARQQHWVPDFTPGSKSSDWTSNVSTDLKRFWEAGHHLDAQPIHTAQK